MKPMTLGRAIAVCKSINSPSPFGNVEEKWEAIRIGNTVFLTEEEAEASFEERDG